MRESPKILSVQEAYTRMDNLFRKEIWDRCDVSLDAEYWQYMLSNMEQNMDIGTFMRL